MNSTLDADADDAITATVPSLVTVASPTAAIPDNLYVEFHDDLFDLIRTTDMDIAEQKGASLVRHLHAQVTTLEASANSRIPLVNATDLPPDIRECFTTKPILQDININTTRVKPADNVEKADSEDKTHGAIYGNDDEDDSDDDQNTIPRRGRGRLATLLSVQGYGLDASDMPPKSNMKYMQQQSRQRKRNHPGCKRDIASLNDLALSSPTVLNDSAAIRAKFKEGFDDPSFFPRSYQVTEIYLPRTIYENHSLRYQAKKRIRPDRDTLSGLIVTLRKEPPPWGFT